MNIYLKQLIINLIPKINIYRPLNTPHLSPPFQPASLAPSRFLIFIKFIQRILKQMSTRKTWTEKQDEALRALIEEQHMTKWADIAHVMADRFGYNCNEKQCRSRYLHKLAKTVNSSPLTPDEENSLFDMQAQMGNRWAAIAAKLSRTDNFVKNYFYAKLRRCMRKINKILAKFLSKQFHRVETSTLYKIIETAQHNPLSRRIRDQLRNFEDQHYDCRQIDQKIKYARAVALQIAAFEVKVNKNTELGQHYYQHQRYQKEQKRERQFGQDQLYDSESYHSSNPSSHHNTINSYNTTSSRSRSNSHSNSSLSCPSFKPSHQQPSTPNPFGSHHFLPMPTRITRTRSNDFDNQDPSDQEQEGQQKEASFLFRSSNLENRSNSKKRQEMEVEAQGQEYLTSSVNVNMFDQVIKIRFISPRVSPESSSKHSSDKIQVEAQALMENQVPQENLWEIIAKQKQPAQND